MLSWPWKLLMPGMPIVVAGLAPKEEHTSTKAAASLGRHALSGARFCGTRASKRHTLGACHHLPQASYLKRFPFLLLGSFQWRSRMYLTSSEPSPADWKSASLSRP